MVVSTILLFCGFTIFLSLWVFGFVLGSEGRPFEEGFITKLKFVTREPQFESHLAI